MAKVKSGSKLLDSWGVKQEDDGFVLREERRLSENGEGGLTACRCGKNFNDKDAWQDNYRSSMDFATHDTLLAKVYCECGVVSLLYYKAVDNGNMELCPHRSRINDDGDNDHPDDDDDQAQIQGMSQFTEEGAKVGCECYYCEHKWTIPLKATGYEVYTQRKRMQGLLDVGTPIEDYNVRHERLSKRVVETSPDMGDKLLEERGMHHAY